MPTAEADTTNIAAFVREENVRRDALLTRAAGIERRLSAERLAAEDENFEAVLAGKPAASKRQKTIEALRRESEDIEKEVGVIEASLARATARFLEIRQKEISAAEAQLMPAYTEALVKRVRALEELIRCDAAVREIHSQLSTLAPQPSADLFGFGAWVYGLALQPDQPGFAEAGRTITSRGFNAASIDPR